MTERDSRTYYISGNRVVAVFDAATNTKQDYEFLKESESNSISGQHYNRTRWVWDRKMIESYENGYDINLVMGNLVVISDEHPIAKIIAMYKLLGALPDATEDWSNDGYLP